MQENKELFLKNIEFIFLQGMLILEVKPHEALHPFSYIFLRVDMGVIVDDPLFFLRIFKKILIKIWNCQKLFISLQYILSDNGLQTVIFLTTGVEVQRRPYYSSTPYLKRSSAELIIR